MSRTEAHDFYEDDEGPPPAGFQIIAPNGVTFRNCTAHRNHPA
jgi:hypothetical protein